METPPVPVEQNLLNVFVHIEVTDDEDDCARCEASRLATMPATYSAAVLSPTMKTLTPALSNAEPPPGAIIIEDPYEVHLRTALEDCGSDCLTIAKESSALHTILPLINHNQYVELVLNPGSKSSPCRKLHVMRWPSSMTLVSVSACSRQTVKLTRL